MSWDICFVVYYYGFKPQQIVIMPYGVKLNFKINYNDYNNKIKKATVLSVKRAIIALAGPLINIFIATLASVLLFCNIKISFFSFTSEEIIYSNLLIAGFNLLPIYPMDGGRFLKELLHINFGIRKSYQIIQDITWMAISVVSATASVLILYYKNIAILIVIIYLWTLVTKTEKEINIREKIYKQFCH